MIGIYKITSPKGRVYVGQSKNINKRFKDYNYLHNQQPKLKNSFIKYGKDNHKFEVICECKIDELNDLERYYQEVYDCVNKGLNCEYVNDSNSPKQRSEETKKKIGDFNRNKKRSEDICLKISQSRKGIKFSESHKKNIRISKTGQNNKRSKLVLDLSTGVFYDSIAEAGKTYSIDSRTLSRYLNGTRKNITNLISI